MFLYLHSQVKKNQTKCFLRLLRCLSGPRCLGAETAEPRRPAAAPGPCWPARCTEPPAPGCCPPPAGGDTERWVIVTCEGPRFLISRLRSFWGFFKEFSYLNLLELLQSNRFSLMNLIFTTTLLIFVLKTFYFATLVVCPLGRYCELMTSLWRNRTAVCAHYELREAGNGSLLTPPQRLLHAVHAVHY